MTKASFVVPVADIERGPRTVTFTLDEAWLSQALEGTEATPRRAGSATVELSKSGKGVMIRGRVEAALSMPCVVTLDPLDIDVSSEVFLMLSPGTSEVSTKMTKKGRAAPGQAKEGKEGPAEGRGAGARKRPSKDEDEEGELLDEHAAARDTFEGSQIELDPFFREFIVLELPMFPRRSDLPSSEGPAIGAPAADSGEQTPAIDPRLQPLAALRSRMRESKE
ncbi:MAG: DUF177 domain-containing protein [Pseudomonadota bacterium]